jgi:hypothetical protein
MKAPSPIGKALSRRFNALFAPLFTTFSRRLLVITWTDRRLFREVNPLSMQREVRTSTFINFT